MNCPGKAFFGNLMAAMNSTCNGHLQIIPATEYCHNIQYLQVSGYLLIQKLTERLAKPTVTVFNGKKNSLCTTVIIYITVYF